MRKKFLLMFLVLQLFTSMGGGLLFAQTTTISSVEDLVAFATSVNGGTSYEGLTVTLTSDLNLSGEWTPIGNGSRSSKTYTGNSFKGIFDGGDHAISGLTITSTSGANAAVGLFGIVDGGTVKNLKLTDVNINVPSSNLAGAAIGMMLNGATANNITVSGAIVGNDGVGGIVGRLIIHGTISNCINNASVTSSYGGIGGIVGKPYYEDGANTSTFASITNCTNNGTVTAPMYIGGIAGLARANVTNCTNEGAIVGGTQTGGIVGQLIAAGTVSGNENKAKVSGKNHLGGIIGDYSQSNDYTYYNVSIANNINRGELAATQQCAAILGVNNIDGFTAMTATGNVSYYYVEGLEMFGNPEDMVIDATNEFIIEAADFATFKTAVEAGINVTLTADITVDTKITAIDGTEIDLNDKTLYVNVENSDYNNVTIKNGNVVLGKDDVHVCDGYFKVAASKTLVLDGVNMSSSAEGIKGYAVFHLYTGANLDLINSTLNISDNEYSAGYIVYAGEATATVDVTGTTITGSKVNGIVHATTVIDESTVTLTNVIEHGINRSGVTIDDSNVTISGGTGRGITAQHGPLNIIGNSVVSISEMGEATIELRNNQNLTVAETATVTVDAAVNNTTSGTITGNVTVDAGVGKVAKVGNTYYKSLQAAINAAVNGDVVTLLADNAENVTVTQKPDVKFTIDGADKTMTGTITIDGKTAAYATAGITVKNMNFTAATEAVCINLGVSGNNNTRYTNNVTVESCIFTGTDKTAVGIKSYTGGDKNLIVKDCTATGMHSLMQLKNTAGVSVTECEITESKNGISLGASSGVAINGTTVDCDGYGVRADANDNGNATITDCTIEAFIPVVVRNASKDYGLQFNGENTMTATNEDGLWCAIGTSEYGTNGTMPTAPTGDVTVTLNGTGLSMDGVYGEHFALNGEGTAESPYLINNLYELKGFRDDVNAGINYAGKYVKLAADIDLNNEEWTPIGNDPNKFEGYFDGNNKTISNLKVTGNTSHKGFFGYIKGTGMSATTTPSVKDLTLDGVNVNVEGDGNYVGGLAGQAYTCNITNVTVKGNVSGVRYVGGLVGHVYTYFKNCHFIGNASCSFDALGGIAGAGDCRAYDCSVIGDITGSNWVGGIVGNGQEGTSAVGCYVKGDVKTATNWYFGVGGIAGVAGHGYSSSEFKNNYFDGEVYLEGEKVPAMIIGIVNAENNETINATIEGNSWNTEHYDAETPVYVTAESPQDGTTEDWIARASEELTKPRNNNLVMLESDIQYVDATDIEDVTIMKFSEVTEDDILPQIEENNQVAYIDSNADGAYNEGETKYTSLADAYTAATDGQTITLLKNITLGEKFDIAKSITLDGNDKTLTYTGTDRAIDVPNDANANIDVTVKNLTVVATTANRGLNYNENGEFNVEGVTVTIGENVDGYAINFPGMADDAQVTIKDSKLTSRNPLNIWGENMVINVYDSEIISVDNSTTYDYAAIQLNNDNYGNVANGTVVNVYGGTITALNDNGEPSNVVANATETGVVNINDETIVTGKVLNYVANIGGVYFGSLQAAVNAIEKYDYNSPIVIMKSFATSETDTVKNGLNVTIDLNGKTITVTDNTTKNFEAIKNQGTLTIKDSSADKTGKITVTATTNSGWNRYSAVIANTVGGKLTVDGGTLEHLGGTDMAYGIDNLTNGKGTYAETVINGGTIKSTYRGIRQFLNGTEAQNILTVNGGTIEGANKSIWMQDPSDKANTGTLTVGENANLIGDVYLFVTAGSTEWPVEVSIAADALAEGSEVIAGNVPAGYELQQKNGNYVVNSGYAKIGETFYATLQAAIDAAQTDDVIYLIRDNAENILAGNENLKPYNKSITIEGDGFTATGSWGFGRDDNNKDNGEITINNVNFVTNGVFVSEFAKVTITNCTFTNIETGLAAIRVLCDNNSTESVTLTGNTINGVSYTDASGIRLRNANNVTITDNVISNVNFTSILIEGSTNGDVKIENNVLTNWAYDNGNPANDGRAIRIVKGEGTLTIANNVMIIDYTAPEEFVKVSDNTENINVDENYWNGAEPTANYFDGVTPHNYYAAYDAETKTLSDLRTIAGAGETLEIFYTAAGETTEQANAVYSLLFTITDYANDEVSVKIGSEKPATRENPLLNIPANVTINNVVYDVTSVEELAFHQCFYFSGDMTLPATIKTVGANAFNQFNNDANTVAGTLTLSENLVSIGQTAFMGAKFSGNLTIPSKVKTIGVNAFSNSTFDGILTIASDNVSISNSFAGSSFKELVIADNVENIIVNNNVSPFANMDKLETVTIPSELKSLGWGPFNGSDNIKFVKTYAVNPPTYAANLYYFSTDAVKENAVLLVYANVNNYVGENENWGGFKNVIGIGSTKEIAGKDDKYSLIATITSMDPMECSVKIGRKPVANSNAELVIPETVDFVESIECFDFNVTAIEDGAFSSTIYFVGDFTVPQHVRTIGTSAFNTCFYVSNPDLRGTLTLNEDLVSIGSQAFKNAYFKGDLNLPASVENIVANAFQLAQFGGTLTINSNVNYQQAFNGSDFTKLVIAKGVEEITSLYAFAGMKSLKEVVIPSTLNTLGVGAFYDVESIESVMTYATDVPEIRFYSTNPTQAHPFHATVLANATLWVVGESYEDVIAYNDAVKWQDFANIHLYGAVATVEGQDYYYEYLTFAEALADENADKVQILESIVITENTELDLNGKTVVANDGIYPAIRIQDEANVTVTGEGSITNNDYVFVLGDSEQTSAGYLTIESGVFTGTTTVASVTKGSLTINGGEFKVNESEYGATYMINCIDKNYKSEEAVVSITGGKFYGFNPQSNAAEGAGTNFCAEGFGAKEVEENVWEVFPVQTTQLSAGWNWFSAYVDIENNGLTMIQNALGTNGIQIKKQGEFSTYEKDLETWFGNFAIYNKETLFINVAESQELTIVGEIVNPEDHTITLNPNWNWIGYPLNTTLLMSEAFEQAGLTPSDGDIVKHQDDFASYLYIDEEIKGWIGNFYMNPGEGFMYMNNSTSSNQLTYKYPTNSNNRSETRANVTTEVNHWTPNASQYPNNMTMMAMVDVEGGDYEVAAFVDGEVRGSARPIYVEALDSYMLFLTIHGEGVEEMTFKFYDLATGEESALNDRMNYSDNAIVGSLKEPYMFNRGTTGIGEAAMSEVNIYPNPTTTGTEINLQATCDKVEVFNALGVKVAEYQNVDSIDAIETAGIYVIRITNNGNVQNCRLVVK